MFRSQQPAQLCSTAPLSRCLCRIRLLVCQTHWRVEVCVTERRGETAAGVRADSLSVMNINGLLSLSLLIWLTFLKAAMERWRGIELARPPPLSTFSHTECIEQNTPNLLLLFFTFAVSCTAVQFSPSSSWNDESSSQHCQSKMIHGGECISKELFDINGSFPSARRFGCLLLHRWKSN